MILPPFSGHARPSTQHRFLDGGHGTMVQSWNVGPVMAELSRSGGDWVLYTPTGVARGDDMGV